MNYTIFLIFVFLVLSFLIRTKKIFLFYGIFLIAILFSEFSAEKKIKNPIYLVSLSLTMFSFPVLINRFGKMFTVLSEEKGKEYNRLEAVLKDMERKFGELEVTIKNLERDNLTMLDSYEMTREMSEVLSFEDIFKFLQKTLRKNFSFHKGFFVILRPNPDYLEIDKIYEISSPLAEELKESYFSQREYYKVLEQIYRDGGVFYFSPDDEDIKRRFGIEVKNDFAVSALRAGERVIGFLILEGLKKEDFAKFSVFSTQMSLELRKVILYEEIEKLATTDSLTGLYVRREIIESLEEELERARRHKLSFAFLMLDIDHFKKCNDRYGHLAGDYVLRQIARILKTNLREIDLVGRYGGEEMAVLLLNTHEEEARLVAERIREAIGKYPFKFSGEEFKITISIGGAIYPGDGDSALELIANADKALYLAKERGRNCVVFYRETV